MDKGKFIFLLSTERSGTNLLTHLLNAHSLICAPSPSHLYRTFLLNISNYGNLHIPENKHQLFEDIVAYFEHMLGVWNLTLTSTILEQIPSHSITDIIKHIYLKERDLNQKKHVFVKENQVYLFHQQLPSTSAYIYLVRDPRDVVLSILKSNNHRLSMEDAALKWHNEQLAFLNIYKKKNVPLVKYEDLVSTTSDTLTSLQKKLDLPIENLDHVFHQEVNTLTNSNRIDNWKNLQKGIISDNYHQYKKELSITEIRTIENICRETMHTLGYENFNEKGFATAERRRQEIELSDEEILIREKRINLIRRIINRRPIIE